MLFATSQRKNLKALCLANICQLLSATTYLSFSPVWEYNYCIYDGNNNIPDASVSSHVTSIVLGLDSNANIYSLNVVGDGVSRAA